MIHYFFVPDSDFFKDGDFADARGTKHDDDVMMLYYDKNTVLSHSLTASTLFHIVGTV